MRYTLHPEVYLDVMTAYWKMYAKNPGADRKTLWESALRFTRAKAMADTMVWLRTLEVSNDETH